MHTRRPVTVEPPDHEGGRLVRIHDQAVGRRGRDARQPDEERRRTVREDRHRRC
ncbi:hypothetical protein [Streptomyces sp. NPDC057403]|uniref:hypothetical protein n=1 Tax=Streptomyces sp. NPDC057403 TaxID=3346119 RepID=UPI0036957D9A